jgi:hypothetical protein
VPFSLNSLFELAATHCQILPYQNKAGQLYFSSQASYVPLWYKETGCQSHSRQSGTKYFQTQRKLSNFIATFIASLEKLTGIGLCWLTLTWLPSVHQDEYATTVSFQIHNFYSPPSIIRTIRSTMMRWAGHVARLVDKRNAYRILVGKPEGKRPQARPRLCG